MSNRQRLRPAPTVCVLVPVEELRDVVRHLRAGTHARGVLGLVVAHLEAVKRLQAILARPRRLPMDAEEGQT